MSVASMLKSTFLIGGASSANVVIGIVRAKLLALMVGPSGIGILGLFMNVQESASIAAGLGMRTTGVRQLAARAENPPQLSWTYRALLLGSVAQGLTAGVLVWLLREEISRWVFGDTRFSFDVGLLGVAAFLMVMLGFQHSVLQGMRRIRELAFALFVGNLAGAVLGLWVVWTMGDGALAWFVLIQSLASVVVASVVARRVVEGPQRPPAWGALWQEWRGMAIPGIAFMLSAILPAVALLVLRGHVVQTRGLEAAGLFQASWTISMQYVGLILVPMGTDFFPRLSAVIEERSRARDLVNDQIQIALALGGPILIGLLGFSHWVIWLLYSGDFSATIPILQWQTVGNLIKLAAWPFGFIMMAQMRSALFFGSELLWNASFVALSVLLLPVFGISALGIGFLLSFLLSLVAKHWISSRILGFRWHRDSIALFALNLVSLGVVFAALRWDPLAGAATSVLLAFASVVAGARLVLSKVESDHRYVQHVEAVFDRVGWPIRRDEGVTRR